MNKTKFKKQLIIGSANFSQKYGADFNKVSSSEVKKILNLAKKNNIYEIDTAEAYLKDKNTFQNISKKFKFLSKISINQNWTSLEFCHQQLKNHFSKLNDNRIQTLLIHNPEFLYKKNSSQIFKNLENLKKKKYFDKIGLSIYDTGCLDYMISNFDLDVVQCPYNILDKRILTTGWFDKLKSLGIQIHVRSIFLQGLLVNRSVHKKKYFRKWKNFFYEWFLWLDNNNISPINYCLSDISYCDFDKIIIGINDYASLKDIINYKKININKMFNFKTGDLKLIDPRNWK